ncbi:MAG: TIGR04100 family radical SAM protein [Bacillota bacterium]|jgi:radical SAM enzyme (TIGR04100 family)
MDFMYDYDDGLYFNLTNRCPCRCGFCIRGKVDALGSAENLWLKNEPTADEVIAVLRQVDFKYNEIVFCGYGEPMERVDDILKIADFIKENYALPVRINTNGLGDLINKKDTVRMLAGHIDAVSVSLNAPNSERYQEICKPVFGGEAYPAMLDFTKRAVAVIPDVTMSVVNVISSEEIEECRAIAEKIGVKFRVRNCY